MNLIAKKYGNDIVNEILYSKTYKYIERYMKSGTTYDGNKVNQSVEENKTIWVFWLQGLDKAPLLVMKCIESVNRNMPDDFNLILLTKENLDDYIRLPDFIMKKYNMGLITNTHFSDLVRLELLHNYGGCWIDATVYCSDKIPEYMLSGQLFVFKWTLLQKSVLKMSSWFIYARKGEKIISETRSLMYRYWEKESKLMNYFLLHIAFAKVVDSDSFNQTVFRNIPEVCNSNPHVLLQNMGVTFDEEKWKIIKGNACIHKLTYKRHFLRGDIYNFYEAFLEGKLT